MFSMDSNRPKVSSAEGGRSSAASIWGDAQSRAANLEQYNHLLQQGPALRSSLDSRSSGGLFGGELCMRVHHSTALTARLAILWELSCLAGTRSLAFRGKATRQTYLSKTDNIYDSKLSYG